MKKDRFGIFVHREGDDELLFSNTAPTKRGAITVAKHFYYKEFRPNDRKGIYVEVWELTDEGLKPDWGNPVFKL
jgi:hypothetical protein